MQRSKKKMPVTKEKKRLTKRMYVYLAFVTMAAVSLFAKPIRRGLSALKHHLSQASAKANLRQNLKLYSTPSTVKSVPVYSPYSKDKKSARRFHSEIKD